MGRSCLHGINGNYNFVRALAGSPDRMDNEISRNVTSLLALKYNVIVC